MPRRYLFLGPSVIFRIFFVGGFLSFEQCVSERKVKNQQQQIDFAGFCFCAFVSGMMEDLRFGRIRECGSVRMVPLISSLLSEEGSPPNIKSFI